MSHPPDFAEAANSLAGVGTGIPSLARNGVLAAIMGIGKHFSLAPTRRNRSIELAQDISQLGDRSLRVDSFEMGKETTRNKFRALRSADLLGG